MKTPKSKRPARCSRPTCSLLPCSCGGKVGSRAAVKFHPRLNLMDGITRYDVRCARCKKVATTKDGKGFQKWQAALKEWNHKANTKDQERTAFPVFDCSEIQPTNPNEL